MTSLPVRIALRELAGGYRGFLVYLACLTLGAFAIAATGSVTESFSRGLLAEQRTLLGGDIAFTVVQRRATPEERRWMEARGVISESVTLNVMGEAGAVRKQVDLRAVDNAHPLVGSTKLSGGADRLEEALTFDDGVWGAAVSATTLEQFSLKIGDTIQLGPIEVKIKTQLDQESDGLGTAGAFGPIALVSLDALAEAGRLTNGQLFRSTYRMLPVSSSEQDIDNLAAEAEATWGNGGLRVRRLEDAVDGLQNLLSMLNVFLSVIGVAALIAGGVGIAQATSAFLQSRVQSIAAFKALGAHTGLIRSAYALQLGGLASIGAFVGMSIGALAPYAVSIIAGDRIPLPQILSLYPGPLVKAFSLSLLTAALFALPALGRAAATPPAALFRSMTETVKPRLPRLERTLTLAAALALIVIAALTSPRPFLTLMLLAGAAIVYGMLLGVAQLIRLGAHAIANKSEGLQRLAMANLGGPGSLAPTIAPALGLGLALLTLVASVQANLLRQVRDTAPANVPSMVFSQIPGDAYKTFDAILSQEGVDISDPDLFRRAPQMIGRVTRLKGKTLIEEDVAESERWVVDGEIGLTYLSTQPPEAELTDGVWWPEDYNGPLLVSVEDEAARGLGLSIGDNIGFRIYGRELEAKVTSLRKVDWGGFGANTVFIFSPGSLEGANPPHFAIARANPNIESAIVAALGDKLPDVVVFQTSAILAIASQLLGNIAVAINAAASIVTVAGLLVLVGAFAAMTRKRRAEAALLKTFGATKNAILALYAGEFAIAGAASAALGALIGVGAAYPVVVNVFEATWHVPWATLLIISGFAILSAAFGGAITGMVVLSRSPAQVLRTC